MAERNLATRCGPWKRLFDTNPLAAVCSFTSGGLAAKIGGSPFAGSLVNPVLAVITSAEDLPTTTDLTYSSGGETPNAIQFRFFGDDANNKSFSARVFGIEQGISTVGTTKTISWEATLLAQYLITFGNINGATGTMVDAGSFEADTIVLTYGVTNDNAIQSNANDVHGAMVRLDHQGFPILAVEFDETVNSGSAATACNGLYRWLW